MACCASVAQAQALTERGFIDARGNLFAETAPNDSTRAVGDVLFREEVFYKPVPWFQAAAGLDLRANTHEQVEDQWRLDFSDRSILRPRAAVRRLSATLSAGHFTIDLGKQFIRWARADILNPTDRFASRDYLTVLDADILPVLGVRPTFQLGSETLEAVWVPRLTPSRLPLIDQRWAVVPPGFAGFSFVDGGSIFPKGSQEGVRWRHTGERFEGALSFYNGYSNLPDIGVQPLSPTLVQLIRTYPRLRTYGADTTVPTSWATFKAEAAYFQSPSHLETEYVLYVLELERQVGEWLFDGGYAGEKVTENRGNLRFAADEGLARSIIAHASYTVDPRRTVTIEGAVKQNGDGFYIKGEFSEAVGKNWRVTVTGIGIAGSDTDFIGQYHRNSYGSVALRYNF
jgi:hypothetical protein